MTTDKQRLETAAKAPLTLRGAGAAPEQVHIFDDESVLALRAALAARRRADRPAPAAADGVRR